MTEPDKNDEIKESSDLNIEDSNNTDDSKLKPKHWFYIIISSLVAIFIIVLFLIPEIMPQEQEIEEAEYNYFKFRKIGPVWETLVMNEGQLIRPSIRFLPQEVENITITGKLNEKFYNILN